MPPTATESPTVTPPPIPPRWRAAWPWAATAFRLLIAATWLWAGLAKIGDPAASLRAVRAYRVLPEWLAQGVAYGLPWLEIALALLLLLGLATRLAAFLSAVLLLAFLAGMISAAARGLRIECGCFGGGGDLAAGGVTRYTAEILRDVGLLVVFGLLAAFPRSRFAADDAVRASVPGAAERVGPRRTKAAQERLAALMEERRRAGDRRVRTVSGLAGVVLVAVAGVGVGVGAARVGAPEGPRPQAVSVTEGVVVGKASAPVTVELYEDLQCPACREFEASAGPVLKQYVDAGRVTVHYLVVSFLDSASTTRYSSRAANAAYCAADAGVFQSFHDLLYANQPPEGGTGLTEAQLIEYGRQAGATGQSFADCVTTTTYGDFVTRITDQASRDGISATPTVLVNRTQLTQRDGAGLRSAIDRALG